MERGGIPNVYDLHLSCLFPTTVQCYHFLLLSYHSHTHKHLLHSVLDLVLCIPIVSPHSHIILHRGAEEWYTFGVGKVTETVWPPHSSTLTSQNCNIPSHICKLSHMTDLLFITHSMKDNLISEWDYSSSSDIVTVSPSKRNPIGLGFVQ